MFPQGNCTVDKINKIQIRLINGRVHQDAGHLPATRLIISYFGGTTYGMNKNPTTVEGDRNMLNRVLFSFELNFVPKLNPHLYYWAYCV